MFAAAWSASRPAPANPLNAPIGRQRRFGTSAGDLDDYKAIRKEHGGTVNDVVLTVVTGALRRWMTTRGEPVRATTTVRAMVPVSVRARSAAGKLGNQISAYFVDLPVGEPDPVTRLKTVAAAMAGHKGSGQAIGASALIGLVGLATPTVHSLGARLTSSMSSRMFNVVVTNVPGPQFPLYAMGARMRDMYPVVPLAKGQTVSIGITSYDGGIFYGLNADRDAMGDRRRARRRDRCEPRRTEEVADDAHGAGAGRRGILGSAWMTGALPAVQERIGRPLGELDLVLGTSAGAVLGAALRCGMSVDELLAHQHGATPAAVARHGDDLPDMRTIERESGDGRPPLPLPWIGSPRLVARAVAPRHGQPGDRGVRAAACGARQDGVADPDGGALQARLGVTARRLGARRAAVGRGRRLRLRSSDRVRPPRRPASTVGEAVLASCSIPGWFMPQVIDGHRYVDGGVASSTSLGLLARPGAPPLDEVYVLAPLASHAYDRPRDPIAGVERGMRRLLTRWLDAEVRAVRAAGVRVTVLTPGPADLAAMGGNLMNPRRRGRVLDVSLRTSATALELAVDEGARAA